MKQLDDDTLKMLASARQEETKPDKPDIGDR